MKNKVLQGCLEIAQEKNKYHLEPYRHYSFIIQYGVMQEYGMNRSGPPLIHLGYPEHGKIHSETEAFRKASHHLYTKAPFQCVNIRLNRHGIMRSSKPCVCCYNFLRSVNCEEVWFTTDVGFARMTL